MNSASSNKKRINPPRWADRFLVWYCNPILLEEIQGDAYELFYRVGQKNKSKARWGFIWNVFRFLRWRNIRKDRIIKPSASGDMIKSYLKSGIRNMIRNATPSLINIVGLSIAIGIAVTVFVLEDSFYHLDTMHSKADRIALVVNHIKDGDDSYKSARSPHPLAELLKSNSSVEMVARAGRTAANVRVGELVFRERIFFADPEFMKMFDFEVINGDRNALSNKNQLLISRTIANKYFGNVNVIGKLMSVKFSDEYKYDFSIAGVLEDAPANSSMYLDILVPSAVWVEMNKERLNEWDLMLASNFILKKEGTDWNSVSKELDQYKNFQNKSDVLRPIQKVELIPLLDVAPASWNISGSLSWSNSPEAMTSLLYIGILMILLASFNYMNVAVASVTTRIKEIGIRKVIGGGKREIIFQFLLENFVLCSIALIVGSLLAYYFLVPGFNQSFPVKIEFSVSSWQMALAFFGGLLILIALISGAYPSLYVSSFSAVKILKGKEKFGSKSKFSKTLLTIQFALSITIVIASLLFVYASKYFEGMDWGYNQNETIIVRLQSPRQYEEINSLVRNSKNIVGLAGGQQHIGLSEKPTNIIYDGKEYSADGFPVGKQYLEVMNLRLKSGRSFDEKISSDKIEGVIVNETFIKKMGWTDPIGREFLCDSVKRYVIGVVEDFYYNDFYSSIEPTVFTLVDNEHFNFVVVKASNGKLLAAKDELKEAWKKIAPDEPTAVSYQSEVFDFFMRNSKANNNIMFFIAIVSIFLAAMGLFGLVSYNLTRRLKEFSVRKVFGAGMFEIFRLMSKDYLGIVIIALLVGAPCGAFLMNSLLTTIYPTVIPTNIWPYIVSVSIMVLMVGLTVFSQFRRVTREDPTETLRAE